MIAIGDTVRGVVDAGTPELQEVRARRLGGDGYAEHYDRGRALDLPAAIEALRDAVGR